MGDVRTQLTPETPGRAVILNPFESPSDYCSLHEPFVSSPTVFKPTKTSATPRQFRWSIDQLAAINPVEIDPEDIHRQALYLSHAKIDKETEERRQRAIEEFFTKRTIVPSPWTQQDGKQAAPFNSTKCAELVNESPLGRVQAIQSGKITVGCQTQLSLPVDFNLEKVLGKKAIYGQFSSSPIQGGRRAYSLGSVASPTFLEKSPNRVNSPSFSPIAINQGKTPVAEQKRLSFPSPETLSASTSMVNPYARSPYIEGCSPIKSIFQTNQASCKGNIQYRTSLFQIPFVLENKTQIEENSPHSSIKSPERDIVVRIHNIENILPEVHKVMEGESFLSPSGYLKQDYPHLQEMNDNDTVEMVDPVEIEDPTWPKDTVVTENIPITSFMTGMTFSVESSRMCMSPLAESSVNPSENSSIQIMDGIGTESTFKENEIYIPELKHKIQYCNLKVLEPESPYFQQPTHKAHKLVQPSVNFGIRKHSNDRPGTRLSK
ncbi:hypothetical protein GDO86_004165 [Hymenochirus boettgeri]|uniref:Protein aurora borealis n=1 Tax=Hymenochirus boettgeri TaxID=247094 RepID=A0A8T2K6T1_9PIPI|nr:hypothetical protein GDO86_004165 [Hymenochirus boettgeri]